MLFFDVEGTYSSIGESIGEHFKPKIKQYVQYRFEQMNDEIKKIGCSFRKDEYYCFSDQILNYSQCAAPNEISELNGIAKATNIPINDLIFAVGYTDIFDLILSRKGVLTTQLFDTNAECTTFIYNVHGKLFCGQNWDMDAISAQNCCYFKKKYTNGVSIQGLSTVIGMIHIGVNNDGLFVGTANLCSRRNSTEGLIFPVTIQHILNKKANKNCLNWLKNIQKVGGHYFYIVNGFQSAIAFECDSEDYSIHQISNSYSHSNHYKDSSFSDVGITYSADSHCRCQFIDDELKNKIVDIDSIKLMLSNHSNNICRHYNNSSYSQTCASIIYDYNNQNIHLCDSNPCVGTWHLYKVK